jgi:uncharacterized protein YbjT (DUF2867 family)
MREEPVDPAQRAAVVAGATGLVGSELVRRLLSEKGYRSVIALARRPLALSDRKLVVVAADFERVDQMLGPATADATAIDVFCCLGTTIGVAGSEAAFRRVDHDFVVALGGWAARVGARRMIVVSAFGADAASRVFYNRVKGEAERDLAALDLPSLVIVRPSLLSGERSEFRFGERVTLALTAPLRKLIPARVRPIAAADVAQAMIDAAIADRPPGVIESAAMQGAAERRAS